MEGLRHVFIVNPVAGRGHHERLVREIIGGYFRGADIPYEIRYTTGPMDAAAIARREAERGGPVRLYACGGDGTLGEVACGAAGRPGVEIAAVPVGTGNDYIKNFGTREQFLNIRALVNGTPVPVDLMRVGEGYAVSLCSVGFDAEVPINLMRFKRLPLVSGPMAYNLSVLYCLLHKMHSHFRIRIDGGEPLEGTFLLCVAANGGWYGGSFHAAPAARVDDGLLDFVVVDRIGRLAFLKMINQYRSGNHDSIRVLHHMRGKRLEVSSPEPFALNCDGEASLVRDISFEVVPAAVRFVLPEGIHYIRADENDTKCGKILEYI